MPFPTADSNGRLECHEIYGGIMDNDLEISAGNIIASIYASACCGGKGGDIYYFGVCADDGISRMAIADVVGHGESTAKVSQYVYNALKSHM